MGYMQQEIWSPSSQCCQDSRTYVQSWAAAEVFKLLTVLHDAFLMLRFPNDQNKVFPHLLPFKGILKTHLMNHAVYNTNCFFLLHNLRKCVHNPISSLSAMLTLGGECLLHSVRSHCRAILSVPIIIRALVSYGMKTCWLWYWKENTSWLQSYMKTK